MKGINTLIKLQQRKVDELRKRLAVLTDFKDELTGRSQTLQQELEDEVSLAGKLAGLGNFFGNFSEHIKKKRKKIALDIRAVNTKIDTMREEIADEFGELKKFEIALDQRKKRAKEKEKRREQNAMDEVAIQKFVRKNGE